VARALGEYAEARRAFEEVAAFGRQVGDKGMEAQMEFALGETALLMGEHAAARQCFERSLAAHACTETGDGVAWVHLYQGHLALDSGDPDTAAACGQRGILEMTQVNNPWGVASAHFLLGSALAARGKLAAAGPHLLEALRLDLQQNSVNLSARHLIALARRLIARGDSIRALEVLETVRASSQSWRDSRTQAAAQLADSLAASLPPAEVEAALARAARHDLLSLTADLLAHQAPARANRRPPAPSRSHRRARPPACSTR
jgi:tetratricopeptide (TPR) repeat protein